MENFLDDHEPVTMYIFRTLSSVTLDHLKDKFQLESSG